MLGRTIIITAAIATSAAVPAAANAGQDLRSPDTRDAAAGVVVTQDLRSPDARDAATLPQRGVESVIARQDLRSPDARDAARDIRPVSVPVTPVVGDGSDGFEWGDAGIGAAGMLGLVALLGGVVLLGVQRRRRHGHLPVAGAH